MNKIQLNYLKAKDTYDLAFQAEDWDKVEAVEDDYIKAELELIEWLGEVTVEHGKEHLTEEDVQFIMRNTSLEQQDRLVDMALRLRLDA